MAIVKSIALGKKDAVLKKWRDEVTKKEERMLSFLIKQALLTFYKTGNFLEIGRIHFSPDKDVNEYASCESKGFNIWLDDAPELIRWCEELGERNIAVTKVFKEVLVRCIKIIPENEEVYIPSYYEIISKSDSHLLSMARPEINNGIRRAEINPTPVVVKNEVPNTDKIINDDKVKEYQSQSKVNSKKKSGENVINSLGLGVRR